MLDKKKIRDTNYTQALSKFRVTMCSARSFLFFFGSYLVAFSNLKFEITLSIHSRLSFLSVILTIGLKMKHI
jgi:hypothetical protein